MGLLLLIVLLYMVMGYFGLTYFNQHCEEEGWDTPSRIVAFWLLTAVGFISFPILCYKAIPKTQTYTQRDATRAREAAERAADNVVLLNEHRQTPSSL